MCRKLSRYTALFCCTVVLMSTGGVWAVWKYANLAPDVVSSNISININEFPYAPDMPEAEVSFLERLKEILNNEYSNELISESSSRDYLFDSMDKDWSLGENPSIGSFVGSMDASGDSKEHINAMFGDCIDFSDSGHVSFILKSEDLLGDIFFFE